MNIKMFYITIIFLSISCGQVSQGGTPYCPGRSTIPAAPVIQQPIVDMDSLFLSLSTDTIYNSFGWTQQADLVSCHNCNVA